MKVADLNGNGVLDCAEFFDFIGHRDSLMPSSHHQSHKTIKVRVSALSSESLQKLFEFTLLRDNTSPGTKLFERKY